MPIAYNGSSSGITVGQAVTVTNPVDGDALTAASNNTAVQTLANVLQFLQERALINNGYNNTAVTANAHGGVFTGNGLGSGVVGNAGATAGGTVGVMGISSAGAGSMGVQGSSTATTGTGVQGVSDLYRGVDGVANGTGAGMAGVYGRIAPSSGAAGAGVYGDANGNTAAAGVRAKNGASGRANKAIEVVTGHLKMASGNAANTEGFTNALVANNIVKAYGRVTWMNAAPVLDTSASFNVASISSPANGQVDVTLAAGLSGYGIVLGSVGAGNWAFRVPVGNGGSPYQFLVQNSSTGAALDFTSSTGEARFLIIGPQ